MATIRNYESSMERYGKTVTFNDEITEFLISTDYEYDEENTIDS